MEESQETCLEKSEEKIIDIIEEKFAEIPVGIVVGISGEISPGTSAQSR